MAISTPVSSVSSSAVLVLGPEQSFGSLQPWVSTSFIKSAGFLQYFYVPTLVISDLTFHMAPIPLPEGLNSHFNDATIYTSTVPSVLTSTSNYSLFTEGVFLSILRRNSSPKPLI